MRSKQESEAYRIMLKTGSSSPQEINLALDFNAVFEMILVVSCYIRCLESSHLSNNAVVSCHNSVNDYQIWDTNMTLGG